MHLAGLRIEVAVLKDWKSHYWKEWLQTIVIVIDEPSDIGVNFNWIPEIDASDEKAEDDRTYDSKESIVGSPPSADEDRRVGPALHDQQQQQRRPGRVETSVGES